MNAPVGMVAGAGALPRELAKSLRARGLRVVCVQVQGDGAGLAEMCDRYERVGLSRAPDALRLFREEGVRELVLAGKVDKLQALRELEGSPFWNRVDRTDGRDPELWQALRSLLEEWGLQILPPSALLPHLVASVGVLAGRPPTEAERADLALGFRVAKRIAEAGVGQAVAVRGGVVLAVEAAEGTDGMIRRCSAFGPGAVVVKVAWPGVDGSFDPPVVGPDTLVAMREVGATALGVEAYAALVLDPPAVAAAARELDVSVVGLSG